ncbi:MAG TPA: hypothetical protein DCY42_03650 [Chloroflexi bacterium]|nr:hypothetical protein [Chloroflexota bacterium]
MTKPAHSSGNLPTKADIEELLAFLPRLFAEGFQPVEKWYINTDPLSFPYPIYHPAVTAFIAVASKNVWCDYNYEPSQAYRMLEDPDQVAAASLSQIRTMLTYIVRGERFCDGHWAAMVEHGYLQRLLERLSELSSSTSAQDP